MHKLEFHRILLAVGEKAVEQWYPSTWGKLLAALDGCTDGKMSPEVFERVLELIFADHDETVEEKELLDRRYDYYDDIEDDEDDED